MKWLLRHFSGAAPRCHGGADENGGRIDGPHLRIKAPTAQKGVSKTPLRQFMEENAESRFVRDILRNAG